MRIYLDNNATTPVDPAVLDVLTTSLREVFGNASSIHKEGQIARRRIEDARESVAHLIGAAAREVIFTSGGTESNNAAIFGVAAEAGRYHIVTTAIEHPSVAEPVAELGRRGAEVTVVPPQRNGAVDAAAVIDAIRNDTTLVAVMLANNETGAVQPVAEIGAVCRERGIHLHCDAVQAAGKIAVDVETLGVSTLSLSAHKLHAPKGIGALYVRQDVKLRSHSLGGSQERRRRPGTENVPLAVAFGAAADLAGSGQRAAGGVRELRDRFETAVGELAPVVINAADAPRLPNTSSVTFLGRDGEALVIALDLEGVAASTGSACSSGRVEPSHILLAMGLTPEEARATVRFSLSRFTTAEEIDRAVTILRQVLKR